MLPAGLAAAADGGEAQPAWKFGEFDVACIGISQQTQWCPAVARYACSVAAAAKAAAEAAAAEGADAEAAAKREADLEAQKRLGIIN